ncbi:expressed unknown protein [Seminavis robusta]|uniref:Uncharacterized protein n=1 Tax=Seminavis robusta TaxID=568900 RepID=A0A9N8E1B2_9STRA|nr:expressed unknown protein [Seminavis robusta]|eukprot:Sro448_g145080.1 n/a (599) ;mRNA; f:15071-16867
MVAAVQHPPIQRRRSIDNSATTTAPKSSKMSSGFGALIRRASQRGGTVMNDASQQSSLDGSNNSGSGRIVRGFVKRAKSLRGSMDTSSNSRNGRSSSRDEADDQDDGPSGVASFLSQIEPPQESAAAAVETSKQPEQAPEVEKPKQGGLRGLLRRAASYRSERSIAAAENKKEQQQQQQQAQSHEAEQEELEPVLVLTDGNHGKVVFQNLDPDVAMSMSMNKLGGPTPSSSTYMDHNNASMPDLCGLSVSTSSRSTTSSSDSPVTVSKPLHTASTHTARTSATSRTSLASAADNDFYLDGSMEQQQQQNNQPQPPQEKQQQKQPEPEPKGFTGRLRTLFKRTKSGRTVTEERPGEGAHVYVPSQDVAAASPLHEISLPVLDETDNDPATAVVEEEHSEDPSEEHTEEQDIADSMHDSQHRVMESLLGVVQDYEMHEDQRSYCSTDDDEGYDDFDDGDYDDDDDYYGGDESGEDFGIYDEEPPAAADGQEALESFMASYCPQEPAYGDIQVEPQPARVYDELEIFYEEMTFEHVGGSMLLGAASELLTVPECDGEDFSESEEQFEDQEHEVAALCAGNLLPVMEEDMDESYSSGGSEFI